MATKKSTKTVTTSCYGPDVRPTVVRRRLNQLSAAAIVVGVWMVAGCSSSGSSAGTASGNGLSSLLSVSQVVHCVGEWNYSPPHPAFDLRLTVGSGTWSFVSSGGTTASGTRSLSGGQLTARVTSLSESPSEQQYWTPWLDPGGVLVVGGLPATGSLPATAQATSTFTRSSGMHYGSRLAITYTAGKLVVVTSDHFGPGQTMTCST